MDIIISQELGQVPVTVLSLRGEFDRASEHEMETCAQELIAAGTRHLVIDLAGVPYLGPYSIAAIDRILLFLLDHQPRRDYELLRDGIRTGTFKSPHVKLLNPSPLAYQALHRAGMVTYLEVYHDLSQAIASFDPSRPKAGNPSQGAGDRRRDRLSVILSRVPRRHQRPSGFIGASN